MTQGIRLGEHGAHAPRGVTVRMVCDLADWYTALAEVAEGVVRSNVAWMRARGDVVALESSGWSYLPSTWTQLRTWPIRHASVVALDRAGNCLDLSAYHAAWLRYTGRCPVARVQVLTTDKNGRAEGHAVVGLVGANFFDPSKAVFS